MDEMAYERPEASKPSASHRTRSSLTDRIASMSASKGVAIVTGSAQGIGRGIALRLAADGYNIALFDVPANKSKLEEVASTIVNEKGKRAVVVAGDVSVENDVEALVKQAVDELGSLDVVRMPRCQPSIAKLSCDVSSRWSQMLEFTTSPQ